MMLTKSGVTFEVTHPAEIARLKRAGYVEEKPAEVKPEAKPEEVKPEAKKTTKKDGE